MAPEAFQMSWSDDRCHAYCRTVSTQIVLLHIIAKRPETHPTQLGRFDLYAASSFERLREVAALDLLDVCLEIEAGRGQRSVHRRRGHQRWSHGIASNGGRQTVGQYGRRRLQGDGAFDRVLELADVARPVVPLHQI